MLEQLRIRMLRKSPGADERSINRVERQLGLTFPSDYRTFLKEMNGGRPEPNVYEGESGGTGVGVTEFLGLETQDDGDLLAYVRLYRGRLPPGCLPIALASGGNLICLRDDTVLFWDHEGEELIKGKPARTDNVHKLNDTFTDFLARLKPFEPDDVPFREENVLEAWIDPEFLRTLDKKQS